MSPPVRGLAFALATAGAVVGLDQGAKAAVNSHIDRGDQVELLPFLELANTRNRGVAFGLAGDVAPELIGATLIVLIALLTYLSARVKGPGLIWLPAGLLIGGALGNLADRVRDGAVTDFIDPRLWPTFNLADVAIVAGVALLIVLPDRSEPG